MQRYRPCIYLVSMKLQNIELPMPEIERFCQKWNLTEFALFGSVLRDDFIETSRNYLRRSEVLSSAQVIYESRSSVSA